MPAPAQRRLIFAHIDEPGYTNDLACYVKHGGYEVLKKAFARKQKMRELTDDEIPNVIALGRQVAQQAQTPAEQEARKSWSERSHVPLEDPAKKGAAE